MLLASGLLVIMLGSTSIVAFHFLSPINPSEEGKSIVINSVELVDLAIGWSPHVYKIDIDFTFVSDESFDITYGCSSPFWAKLVNSEEWQLAFGDCEAWLTHSLEAGSKNYSLAVELIPKSSDSNPSLPRKLDVVVVLGDNLVISDIYSLSLNFQEGKSIVMKSAELKTTISHEYGFQYSVNAVFDFISDIEFDITYGCSSPFDLELVSDEIWQLVIVDCEALLIHTLPAGTTEFSLSGELMIKNGFNPEPPLPEQLLIRVALAQNLLLSNVYTLALS
jgi:hypothetical protein